MAIYKVNDARHRIPYIALAVNADNIICYGLGLLGTSNQGYLVY